MKKKLIGWVVFLAAAIAIVMVAGHPSPLPTSQVVHPGASLTGFDTSSYSSCASHAGPCLAYLNSGNYPTTAKSYGDQECNTGEFSGPGTTNSNLDSKGNQIDDGWLFVSNGQQQFYDIIVTFKDTSNHTQSVTFPGTANPPNEPTNAANIYFTKNYSHIAVLTSPGWTLTGATGLMNNNKSVKFELSHTCAAQSGGGTTCSYPPGASTISASKVAGTKRNTYTINGTLTDNGCAEPDQKVTATGKSGTSYSAWVDTDSNGKFTFTNIPSGDFPVTLSFAGNASWPPGSLVVA